jgi:hypothetical protein
LITWLFCACLYYRLSYSVFINSFICVWGRNPLPLTRGRFHAAFKILTNRFPVIYIWTISRRGSFAKQWRRGGVEKGTIKKKKLKSSDLPRRLWQILVWIEGHTRICDMYINSINTSARRLSGRVLNFIHDVNIACVRTKGHLIVVWSLTKLETRICWVRVSKTW